MGTRSNNERTPSLAVVVTLLDEGARVLVGAPPILRLVRWLSALNHIEAPGPWNTSKAVIAAVAELDGRAGGPRRTTGIAGPVHQRAARL